MSGSAANLREIVRATERAALDLEAIVDAQRTSKRRVRPLNPRTGPVATVAFEAELTRTLLARVERLRDEANDLMRILERAIPKLAPGVGAPESSLPDNVPFARRSTDPGGAERLKGAPQESTWRGPERRKARADAIMAGVVADDRASINDEASRRARDARPSG